MGVVGTRPSPPFRIVVDATSGCLVAAIGGPRFYSTALPLDLTTMGNLTLILIEVN